MQQIYVITYNFFMFFYLKVQSSTLLFCIVYFQQVPILPPGVPISAGPNPSPRQRVPRGPADQGSSLLCVVASPEMEMWNSCDH